MFANSIKVSKMDLYKLVFFVPVDNIDQVKESVFSTGAGKIGNYENCCFQVLGQGQFRPLLGANPVIGKVDKLEQLAEYRVEILCGADNIKQAVVALKQAHPYEEVAYEVYKVLNNQF